MVQLFTGHYTVDYFDEQYFLSSAIADPRVSPFLLEVLRLRGAEELMHRDQMQRLCVASGGVLRDLISLARSAGQNAYVDDVDEIRDAHVDKAIERLGRSYLVGLGTRQIALLKEVIEGGGFSPSDFESMELLISRRILEQAGSSYEVHPALATVLPETTDKSA